MRLTLSAAIAAATLSMSGPALANADSIRLTGYRITVSCARFLLPGTIWDKPQAVFIDDLLALGYTPERAEAIGFRICKDEALVGNKPGMAATMRALLESDPPG